MEYSRAKLETLENAVLTKTPQEISAIYKQLGELMNTARALGLACRFRGLPYVKALVEGGASFAYTRPPHGTYYTIYYWLAPLEMTKAMRCAAFMDVRDGFFTNTVRNTSIRREEIKTFIALPLEERTKIVRYLCENRERIALDIDELLFYSIISGTKGITKILKEYGAKISEARTKELTDTGRGFQWTEFSYMIDYFDDKEYMEKIKLLYDEMGGKTLRYSDAIYYGNYNMNCNPKQKRMYDPKIFRFVIDHFDRKKMNQKQFMIGAINENSVACLKICAEIGWLNMPRKRDEMIKYASDMDRTECTAFLLDFKNRTADLKAEQERAEKRIMRQINADPNSATEMKKIWGFEKREDGGVIITGYKGKRTEVIVPEKIGSMTVREIGDQAFSTEKPRLRTEQIGLRQNITKITLPETVEAIGNRAFSGCTHLKDINIPEGVRKIGDYAFYSCQNLEQIKLPSTLRELGTWAFTACIRLASIELPEGLEEIGEETFDVCENLKTVSIPSTVRKIGRRAFMRCYELDNVVIPEGVEEIGERAFYCCISLKSIDLPESVKKIKNFTHKNIEPQNIFSLDENVTVTVPAGSYAEKYCRRNNVPYAIKEK